MSTKEPLSLELGKKYITRIGDIVKIVKRNTLDLYPFRGDNDEDYTLQGRYFVGEEDEWDLVSEFIEEELQEFLDQPRFEDHHTGPYPHLCNEEPKIFNKNDDGKSHLAILRDYPLARKEVADILVQGANEYGRKNWKNVPDIERYESALDRHVDAWHNGEKIDPKSGKHHLAHAISNLLFMLELELTNSGCETTEV